MSIDLLVSGGLERPAHCSFVCRSWCASYRVVRRRIPRKAYAVSHWISDASHLTNDKDSGSQPTQSCHIVHNDTFDFFYPTQASIIPIEASSLVNDGRS